MSIDVELKGIRRASEYFRRAPTLAGESARLAIIDALRFARREGSKRVRDEVRLPRSYLGNDRSGTLTITQYPKGGDLEGVVTGRDRPTSLARYKRGTIRRGKPVRVQVSARGGGAVLRRAFPMSLRRGSAAVTEDNFNQGLAIRLKPGERVIGKYKPLDKRGLVLLYGPSVGQVFRSVSSDLEEPASDRMEREFVRQFARLS